MDDSARGGGGGGEDDQQIASAAEAMVQLSGFYGQHTDESMDVDPNYDPSDFLGNLREPREQKPQLDIDIAQYEMSAFQSGSGGVGGGDVPAPGDMSIDRKPQAIHDDLAISDSDEEDVSDFLTIKPEPSTYQDNTNQMNSQGLTMMSNTEPTVEQQQMQPPPPMQPSSGTDPVPNNDDDANDDLLWF